nr:leucine-rich repeat domain-containing protein [uncultured Fluviicola sp.]
MSIAFINKLKRDFDLEIVQSNEPNVWENTFDVDEFGNIRSLHLHDVEIKTLDIFTPIAHSLIELTIAGANIENIETIKSFTKLEYLDLSFNPLLTSTLSNLDHLSKLKELHLRGTNITDTSILGGISTLENLLLSGSDVLDSVNGLESLINLKHLEVNLTEISEIEKIKVSDSLRSLSLKSSLIDRISGLDRFINLEDLYLNSCNVEKLEGLDHLKSLKRLNFNGSNISEIQGLENLISLEVLDFGDNEITSIKGLENLTNLKKLNLSLNEIKKVENLNGLVNLERLMLDGNQIVDFDLTLLKELKKPCIISLSYNPITSLDVKVPENIELQFETKGTIYRVLF